MANITPWEGWPFSDISRLGSYSFSTKFHSDTILDVQNSSGRSLMRLYELAPTFYADPTAADQGTATGSGNQTIKDFINTIGSSPAVIVLISTGASNYTDYAVLTDLEIPSNILVHAHHGARFSVSAGVTLTINKQPKLGLYQVFTGDGSVVFGSGAVTEVYPEWFNGDIQAAAIAISTVGGVIRLAPNTTYIIDDLRLYSNTVLVGDGSWTTVLQHGGAQSRAIRIHGPDATVDNNIKNILIEGFVLQGLSDSLGFDEHHHLLMLGAVSDVKIRNIKFLYPQGDCIYIGDIWAESHNERIEVTNCYFDGYTGSEKGGRNGITITEGTDISIKDNYFTCFNHAGMPGPIDVEPNGDIWTRIRDIKICHNTFEDNDSGGAILLVVSHADEYTMHPENFYIINNIIKANNTFSSNAIRVRFFNPTTPYLVAHGDKPNNIHIEGNSILNTTGSGLSITGVKTTFVQNNLFRDCSIILLGEYSYTDRENVYDAIMAGNIFDSCGNTDGELLLGHVNSVTINENIFRSTETDIDTGICLYASGVTIESFGIAITNNQFKEDLIYSVLTKNTGTSIHSTNASSNLWANNIMEGTIQIHSFLYNATFGLYDFDTDGGAVGDFVLGSIPKHSVITHAWYKVLTSPTSDGAATISLGVYGYDNTGILGATAYDDVAFSLGYHDAVPDGTSANFTNETTAVANIILSIAGADLTAGKIMVWWEYKTDK